ncbi:hypothetical protein HPC49_47235 [Pyxidicoccus fallax]|nr:hypothetical protein [Pyxidicoccus fallax]NPC85771.1 hypothetical protein [Pyxidicoccus fallax]
MSLSPEGRVHRLLSIFAKTGREGECTRAFDRFPDTVRATLWELAGLAPEERPILACFRDAGHWTLITTERVLIRASDHTRRLPWSDIENATVGTGHMTVALASGLQGKLTLDRLTVICRDGEAVELELEPGPSFIGVWNVLKTLGSLGAKGP